MVTASKVKQPPAQRWQAAGLQPQQVSDGTPPLLVGTDPSSWTSARLAHGEDENRSAAGGSTSSSHRFGAYTADSAEDYSDVPLCFGEQLVLETYMKFRGRRYDRKRQEELSQPRRVQAAADEWGVGPGNQVKVSKGLDQSQVENLVGRLARPRRTRPGEGMGHLVAMHSSSKEMAKDRVATAVDVERVFARLAAPKPHRVYDPTPGERVCLLYNTADVTSRAVNYDRLADMARPKKRGGRAESWGVTAVNFKFPSSSAQTTPREATSAAPFLPPAPASARGGGSRGSHPHPSSTAKPSGSSVEKLPEVVPDNMASKELTEEEEEYFDDHEEESDDLPSFPSVGRPLVAATDSMPGQGGAVAAAAASWQPVANRRVPPSMDEDNSDDGDEPFFPPQFGFAGQRVKPGIDSRPPGRPRTQNHEEDEADDELNFSH